MLHTSAQRVDSLTSLRFFAAAAIVLHHVIGEVWLPLESVPYLLLRQHVSLFFVLSGYILHLNYRDTIAALPYHRFMLLRIARIWPAHLFALAFAVTLFSPWDLPWILAHLSTAEITQVILLLQAWNPDMRVAYAINSPSWSISAELFFYALFPLLSGAIRRRAWPMLAAVAALTVLYLLLAQAAFDRGWASAAALAYWSPPARLLEFATGIAACEAVMRRRPLRAGFATGTAVECLALLLVIVAELASPPLAGSLDQSAVWAEYLRGAAPFPAFALLIVVLHRQQGALSLALRLPWLVRLGEWSFALYLVHQPLIRWFKVYVPQGQTPDTGQLILFAAALLGLSAFVFYCIERPGIRFAKHVLASRAAPATIRA